MPETLNCPRCAGVILRKLPESQAEIDFFECPSCQRHYAKRPGRPLTYRWLHPITLAFYGVMFEKEPVLRAEWEAAAFLRERPPEELLAMVREIELELDHPALSVRESLDMRASEEKCREYLRAFVAQLRKLMGS